MDIYQEIQYQWSKTESTEEIIDEVHKHCKCSIGYILTVVDDLNGQFEDYLQDCKKEYEISQNTDTE